MHLDESRKIKLTKSVTMNLPTGIKVNKCAVFSLIALLILLIYIFAPNSSSNSVIKENKENKVNLRKLVIGLILAARQGGKEVIKVSKEPDFEKKSKGKTVEGVDDPVTKGLSIFNGISTLIKFDFNF